MESIDPKPDEHPPRILVVAGPDIEGEMLFSAVAEARAHVCQPGRPLACPCGVVHQACDPAEMTVIVGRAERAVHAHPDSVAIQVVPFGTDVSEARYPAIAAHQTRDFGPWAVGAVRTAACGITRPGLTGIDFSDVAGFFRSARTFRCLHAAGSEGLQKVALHLAADPALERGATAYVAGLFTTPRTALEHVGGAAGLLAERVSPDASVAFFCVTRDDCRAFDEISILFAGDRAICAAPRGAKPA